MTLWPVAAGGLLTGQAGLAIWLILIFLVVYFILRKYAWGPITTALSERETNIQASIDQAEKALAEAKQISADNAQARREAETQAQRVLAEARETAQRLRDDQVEQTKVEIKQLQAQAEADIEQQKQDALTAVRAEVANLALQAAEKVIQESLDDDKHRRLVDTFLDGFSKN